MERSEAIEVLKKYQYDPEVQEALECLHPELKESEDERIRKAQLKYWRRVGGKEWHGVPVQEAIAWLEKQGSQNLANSEKTCKVDQNPAWSEEDERWFKELELMALSFSNDDSYRKKFFDWLKYLKGRVQPQPKFEWSEEDEKIRKAIASALTVDSAEKTLNIIGIKLIDALAWLERQKQVRWSEEDTAKMGALSAWLCSNINSQFDGFRAFELVDWLKALRPQNHWRPSEGQLQALQFVVDYHCFSRPENRKNIETLLGDLKNL